MLPIATFEKLKRGEMKVQDQRAIWPQLATTSLCSLDELIRRDDFARGDLESWSLLLYSH